MSNETPMIQPFVDKLISSRESVINGLKDKRPSSYDDLVARLVTLLSDPNEYRSPDPERITVIDDGDYQGTRLFVIGATGYQPSQYWSIMVDYGSCSGCDSFEANREWSDEPSDKEAEGNYTMMLHMVQSMREIGGSY